MSSRCAEAPGAALLRGVKEFNERLFFEQHETLEDAWIEESDPVRYLYQGILQIGVGFYHLRRGNYRGATSLLQRGMDYLRPFSPSCLSVNVERLLDDSGRAYRALVELGPARMADFDSGLIPTIEILGRTEERGDRHG